MCPGCHDNSMIEWYAALFNLLYLYPKFSRSGHDLYIGMKRLLLEKKLCIYSFLTRQFLLDVLIGINVTLSL